MTDTISWASSIIFLIIVINIVGFEALRRIKNSELPDEDDEYTSNQVKAAVTVNLAKQRIRLVDSKKNHEKYRPGKLGCSAISKAIIEDYGAILSRSERRKLSKVGFPFIAYYNMG